jgi:uncharacterized protein (TIGR03437 family)
LIIGGQVAQVVTAGTPIGTLSGLMVINAVVPTGLIPGTVPVLLTMGDVSTTQNVNSSVK